MSGAKKGLDPLVECSENTESHDFNNSEDDALEVLIDDPLQATTSKSSEGSSHNKGKNSDPRKKKTGSRLSLSSLFSLSSQGAKDSSRERSRSGWSCDDSSVVMSSLSATDLRCTTSVNLASSKRIRGSDAGSSHDEGGTEMSEILCLVDSEDEDSEGKKKRTKLRECPLCCLRQPISNFPKLVGCTHRSCRLCLMQYVEMEIMENRVEVVCPECTNHLHPTDIKKLVGIRSQLIQKYEQFSIRRYLLTEADARWCPAPDCGYAVIANSCAACPQLKCGREACGALFCYHCKGAWHANQTCDEARRSRGVSSLAASITRRITNASVDTQLKLAGDIKPCPRCRTLIVKMDDGSCNHMVCAMCSAEFCWLCLKEISDLHYLSPTGCTFWGKKPWTRKKKLLWQIGTLIGAPVGIALIAGLSIPGIIFGVPVFVGRKAHQRFISHSKFKRRIITALCVVGSLVISPVLAVMAVGVGVPIMLAYVYGVVPLSLCRNGGCGLSDSSNPQDDDAMDEEEIWRDASGMERSQLLADSERQLDITSVAPTMSIQSGSISTQPVRLSVKNPKRARSPSVSSSSGRTSPDGRINYEEASTKAMAGSHCHFYYDDKSVHTVYSGHEAISYCEEVASTKALAGSVHDSKSLCESTIGRQKHDVGCDGSIHNCACMTPSTSSVDNNKSQSEDVVLVLRRKIESSRPRAVNIAPAANFDEIPADPIQMDSVDIEAQMPCSSRSAVQQTPQSVFHSDSREEQDPFKIRALLDNMKQMVAADIPQEKPYEPTRPASLQKVRRSNSGKSLATVATHSSVPEAQPLRNDISTSPPKTKRGFFRNFFHSRKN